MALELLAGGGWLARAAPTPFARSDSLFATSITEPHEAEVSLPFPLPLRGVIQRFSGRFCGFDLKVETLQIRTKRRDFKW